MIVYLIRHGESVSQNGLNHAGAAVQAGLSDFGRRQTRAAARWFKRRGIDIIFSSPYTRTRETAEIIRSYTDAPVSFDERLAEQKVAQHSFDEQLIKELKRRMKHEHDFVPPDGESFNQAAERFLEALQDIVQSGASRPCVVSHALVIQSVLVSLFSLKEIPQIKEASVTAVSYEKGVFRLVTMSRIIWSFPVLWEKIRRRLFDKNV